MSENLEQMQQRFRQRFYGTVKKFIIIQCGGDEGGILVSSILGYKHLGMN